jgi:hypothetical protein
MWKKIDIKNGNSRKYRYIYPAILKLSRWTCKESSGDDFVGEGSKQQGKE